MANKSNYRYGETNPVITPAIETGKVIQIGDLVELASGTNFVRAASDHTWNTNIATTQEEFHDNFLGVACQQSRSADVDPIRVATEGIFEFDCAAATFKLGALVGTAKQTGNAIENQKVVAVATDNLAIGRVAADYPSNTTKVLVRIMSTIMYGGSQAMA